MREDQHAQGLSRRNFLGAAAVVGSAAFLSGLAGCAPNEKTEPAAVAGSSNVPDRWDKEADVVVLGAGAGGLSAAIQAATDGASVLILEKANQIGGTTALSAAVIHAADTPQQKEFSNSKDDTTDKFEQWLLAVGEGMVDETLVKDYAAHAKDHIAELAALGGSLDHLYAASHVPGVPTDLLAERIHYFTNPAYADVSGGTALANTLHDGAVAAGATVELETEATHLIVDGEKGVVGVTATQGGATINVKANKGVVIATSGYDHNEEMCRALNPQAYWDLSAPQMLASTTTDTGDGIKMGMEIGADLAGCIGALDMSMPLMSGAAGSEGAPQSVIFVNGNGQRFVAEDSTYGFLTRAYFQQETQLHHPCYVITDSSPAQGMDFATGQTFETTRFGSLLMGQTPEEAVASGAWFEGASLAELGAAIDIDADALNATVNRWNDIVASGKDPDQGRIDVPALGPLTTPPYYAARLTSFSLGPNGGLKINVESQVLNTAGQPIPHLYAAGLAAGGWIGPYYPSSGIAIMGGLHWGRKAGKNAAAESA